MIFLQTLYTTFLVKHPVFIISIIYGVLLFSIFYFFFFSYTWSEDMKAHDTIQHQPILMLSRLFHYYYFKSLYKSVCFASLANLWTQRERRALHAPMLPGGKGIQYVQWSILLHNIIQWCFVTLTSESEFFCKEDIFSTRREILGKMNTKTCSASCLFGKMNSEEGLFFLICLNKDKRQCYFSILMFRLKS